MDNPKTVDGVTVKLGTPVWVLKNHPPGVERNIVFGIFRFKVQWQNEDVDGYIGAKLTICYSNRAAALKALEKEIEL